jgi:malectin (di-glucose binding ER protein)
LKEYIKIVNMKLSSLTISAILGLFLLFASSIYTSRALAFSGTLSSVSNHLTYTINLTEGDIARAIPYSGNGSSCGPITGWLPEESYLLADGSVVQQGNDTVPLSTRTISDTSFVDYVTQYDNVKSVAISINFRSADGCFWSYPTNILDNPQSPAFVPVGNLPITFNGPPYTSAELSPNPDPQGDPVTVTLTAIADSGGSVANTYYTVDGGTQQTYSSPFTVTGDGSHTITYWSVDSNGSQEPPNSDTFTIADTTPTPTPTPVAAINAGGPTAGDFASDTDNNGGSTYTTSSSIDTSGVTNPAPTAVYQTVRYGNFSYTIPNLTANGAYTVQLHFSEPYWGTSQASGGGVGSRIFNVSVNGTQVLSNFDVYQAAGGANKAVMEQIPATADSNGNITINFSSVVDNAMVSGIAVYNGTLPAPSPTPTPTPLSSLAISAGGPGSGSYVADTDYTGGTTYYTSASIDTSGVIDPAPQSVYQNVRYGNTFSYTIPTDSPNTNYSVRLDFSEPYFNSAGSREFNVLINGTQVLNNFDVYATAGGQNKAVSETFNTTSDSNGLIHIQFTSDVDNAMVSGIQISQQ